MSNSNNFIYVTGSKGGVGKSFISNALVCYLQQQGQSDVRIIDTDTNPDIGRIYKDSLPTVFLPISESADSWEEFLSELEKYTLDASEKPISVIANGAAGDSDAIAHNGEILNILVKNESFRYKFTTLWVASNIEDSFDLLRDYLLTVNVGDVVVLLNSFFGEEKKFAYFLKNYPTIANRVNFISSFPRLEKSFADRVHTFKAPLIKFEASLERLVSKLMFRQWLDSAFDVFCRAGF